MSEQHSSEHESLIKTPKQLIIVILLSFIIPIVIAILFSQLATSGRKSGDKVSEEKITQLIQPVARVELAAAGGAAKAAKTSEQIVQAACAACHLSGAAGAPKIGDKAAWAPRLGLGLEGLTQSVITGKGAMPPKGGAADLSEADIARAIAFMANQSGANFKEPAASPVASPAAKAEAPAVPAPAASSPAVAPAAPAAAVKPAEKAAAKPAEAAAVKPAAPAPVIAAPAAAVPTTAAAPAIDGKAVYNKACAACHESGIANAPKNGDKAAWAPRIATGVDTLTANAIKGKGVMPPKGGAMTISDAEVKAAVQHLVASAR